MPEDDTQLRHLVRKAHQLPEPTWNLFARTTKQFSRAGQTLRGINAQEMAGKPKRKYQKKQKDDNKAGQGGQKR